MSILARVAMLVLRAQGKRDQRDRASLLAAIARRRPIDRHAPVRRWRDRYDVRIDDAHGHPCYTIAPRQRPAAAPPAILYLHGGCYTFELTAYHWDFIGALVDRTGATISVPIYPLAPEHDHREGFAMLRPLAEQLRARGPLAVMGDSAGGGLALALAQHLTARATPPHATVLLSPWVDLTLAAFNALPADEQARLERRDPMLSRGGLVAAGEMWANGADPRLPALSPRYGELNFPTPVLVFIGTHEILLPDCRALRDGLVRAGTAVDYIEAANMFHDWMLVVRLPEARRAIDRIVRALSS